MIQLKLDCGIEVNVVSIQILLTYGGMLEGKPNEKINKMIIEGLEESKKSKGLPYFIKQPIESDIKTTLKCCVYEVWLENIGTVIINDKHIIDTRRLGVIWIADSPEEKLLKEIIEEGVRDVDWGKYSEDWGW